jgi:hypothetical protein
MITHMVLLKIRPDVSQAKIDTIFKELAALRKKIPGLTSFAGGPYSSPEGLDRGYTHGFCMTFKDAASRNGYLSHADHEAVKALIGPALEGGINGALAFDFES